MLHIGDNSWQVCAEVKGRSSNRQINSKCRRSAALQLSGDVSPFIFWQPRGCNWADAPSSWFGVRVGKHLRNSICINDDMSHWDVYRNLSPWVSPLIFVHFCFGEWRTEVLEYWLHRFGDEAGIDAVSFSFDVAISKSLDTLDDDLFSEFRVLCWSGLVFGILSGVPCTTWCWLLCSDTNPSPMRTRSLPEPGVCPACRPN